MTVSLRHISKTNTLKERVSCKCSLCNKLTQRSGTLHRGSTNGT